VVGDSLKLADMEAAVQRARVVLSVVGPYALYGTPLVEACVKHGVDYVDLTGAHALARPVTPNTEREREIRTYAHTHTHTHTHGLV
jgi:short subunit dehydrogenase-like uncharacterized protein